MTLPTFASKIPQYWRRQGLYGHFDDAERFAFFSRAVLEMLPYIEFKPDVIHANDWQTALKVVLVIDEVVNDIAYLRLKNTAILATPSHRHTDAC